MLALAVIADLSLLKALFITPERIRQHGVSVI
jgi:hypothetical protein